MLSYCQSKVWNLDELIFFNLAPFLAKHFCWTSWRNKLRNVESILPDLLQPFCSREIVAYACRKLFKAIFIKNLWRKLSFDCYANQKTRMSHVPLFCKFEAFNNLDAKKVGLRVLLLQNNCSAHGSEDNFIFQCHPTVQFLPKAATSHIQPLDAGVIDCIVILYKIRLLIRLLDNVDKE